MQKKVFQLLVDNTSGVLSRISGLFSRSMISPNVMNVDFPDTCTSKSETSQRERGDSKA